MWFEFSIGLITGIAILYIASKIFCFSNREEFRKFKERWRRRK